MKNSDVIRAWKLGRSASCANLRTDGVNLWSYSTLIGRIENGNRKVFDFRATGEYGFVSVTTSRHVSMALRA